MIDDTIAAISTPIGAAGIGIVRISGKDAYSIGKKVFKKKKGNLERKNFSLQYGHVVDPENKEIIDEGLFTYMKGPRSYTGEDVVEINCHGGTISVRKVLDAVLRAGARIAEPGEFSKRAFLNGRIDLAQAESIMDLINAKTDSGLKVALNQLEGKLSKKVKMIRNVLVELIGHIEVKIDFPDEDIEDITEKDIKNKINEIINELDKLIKQSDAGKIYREGIQTIIIGKPNVGKSSLLNALLREKRAIVTDIPGTTRDIIEEFINIKGLPLKIIDTAGIRETQDLVEKIGVEKTRELIERAEFILLLFDAVTGITDDDKEIFSLVKDKKAIILINKIDLNKDIALNEIKSLTGEKPVLAISAKEGTGLDELEDKIFNMIVEEKVEVSDDILVSNVRHKEMLRRAKNLLVEAVNSIENQMPLDCVSIDLKESWEALGEITGETVSEDIIDHIFSQFCLGK